MALDKDIKGILDPLLAAFDGSLTTMFNNELSETYVSGQAEMTTWGKTKAGIPIAYEGPPVSQAVNWAKKRSATLVTKMDEETKRRLAGVISRGIETKRGIPGTAKDIRMWVDELNKDIKNTFIDMSKYRSELIARTETANALSQTSLDSMKDMGINGKEWVTAGDDLVSEECQGNEAEGVIPTNQTFSGGVDAPPQHPDCRCSIAPARLKK